MKDIAAIPTVPSNVIENIFFNDNSEDLEIISKTREFW